MLTQKTSKRREREREREGEREGGRKSQRETERKGRERKREGEKERERKGETSPSLPLWLLFLCFFPPLGLTYVNWASQECCLFYLKSSVWSSDLPLFYFHGLFPYLSFSHRHSGLFCPILTT